MRILLLLILVGCHAGRKMEEPDPLLKIGFDLQKINAAGLRGPANGLVSVDYEFCIPARPSLLKEVQKLDPSVKMNAGRGRIGCKPDTWLCIGQTGELPDWKKRLLAVARLPYVERIEETFYE